MTDDELNALLGLEAAVKPPFYLKPIDHVVEIIMPSKLDAAPPPKPAPTITNISSFVTKDPHARYTGRQVYSGGNVVLGPLTDKRITHYAAEGRYGEDFKRAVKEQNKPRHTKHHPKNVKQSVTSLLESLGLG